MLPRILPLSVSPKVLLIWTDPQHKNKVRKYLKLRDSVGREFVWNFILAVFRLPPWADPQVTFCVSTWALPEAGICPKSHHCAHTMLYERNLEYLTFRDIHQCAKAWSSRIVLIRWWWKDGTGQFRSNLPAFANFCQQKFVRKFANFPFSLLLCINIISIWWEAEWESFSPRQVEDGFAAGDMNEAIRLSLLETPSESDSAKNCNSAAPVQQDAFISAQRLPVPRYCSLITLVWLQNLLCWNLP